MAESLPPYDRSNRTERNLHARLSMGVARRDRTKLDMDYAISQHVQAERKLGELQQSIDKYQREDSPNRTLRGGETNRGETDESKTN